MTIFFCLAFGNNVILGGPTLNTSKRTYSKYFQNNTQLVFHLQLKNNLPEVLLQDFYIHSTYISLHLKELHVLISE